MSKSMNARTRYTTIATLALAAGLAGAVFAGSDKDRDFERRTGPAAPPATAGAPTRGLALEEVLARLRTAGYSDFRAIEHESGRYEVKGSDADGRRVELYVGAGTGEIIKEERED